VADGTAGAPAPSPAHSAGRSTSQADRPGPASTARSRDAVPARYLLDGSPAGPGPELTPFRNPRGYGSLVDSDSEDVQRRVAILRQGRTYIGQDDPHDRLRGLQLEIEASGLNAPMPGAQQVGSFPG
jgi:hypothetical protein